MGKGSREGVGCYTRFKLEPSQKDGEREVAATMRLVLELKLFRIVGEGRVRIWELVIWWQL